MIIKKKYTEKKEDKPIEKTPVADVKGNDEKKAVTDGSSDKNNSKIDSKIEPVKEDKPKEEPPKKEEKADDFSLLISELDFEQRQERRDGTRRRGYRRIEDRNIVSRAQEDAVSIKEAAKQEGYNEGVNKALADIKILNEKLSEFFNYKEYVFQKVSECILDISVEIAQKIINKQIESDKTALIELIKTAVNEVNKTEEKITLKVMPKDVELVRDSIPEIFTDKGTDARIYVVPDNNIREGGVVIETSNGIVDATIETQLKIIQKALQENLAPKEEG